MFNCSPWANLEQKLKVCDKIKITLWLLYTISKKGIANK